MDSVGTFLVDLCLLESLYSRKQVNTYRVGLRSDVSKTESECTVGSEIKMLCTWFERRFPRDVVTLLELGDNDAGASLLHRQKKH